MTSDWCEYASVSLNFNSQNTERHIWNRLEHNIKEHLTQLLNAQGTIRHLQYVHCAFSYVYTQDEYVSYPISMIHRVIDITSIMELC